MFAPFLKKEVVDGKVGSDLADVDCENGDNWLSSKSLEIGTGAKRVLCTMPADKQKTLRLAFRTSLKVMGVYIKNHLPLKNNILRDLQCLHPLARKAESGRSAVSRLCSHLKKVTKTDKFCDDVGSEWLQYSSDTELDSFTCDADLNICCYWKNISSMVDTAGQTKYKSFSFLCKAALTLSHSNAPAERGFSVNNALVTKERASLSERSIIALRVVKDAIRLYGSPAAVPITKSMLQAVKHAHAEYAIYLEEKHKKEHWEETERKRVQEAEQTRKDLQKTKDRVYDQLKEQGKLEEEQLLEQCSAGDLITEASKKLAEAMQGSVKDMQAVRVAQMMLATGNDKLNATAQQLADIKKHKEQLQLKLNRLQESSSLKDSDSDKPPVKKRKVH